MYIIIVYDIEDAKKRNHIYKILKNYGSHVQYSVFECDIKEKYFNIIKNDIDKIIDKTVDSVIFYKICKSCINSIERFGVDKTTDNKYLIF